jgi:DNA-binding response OmpR family regulator
MRILYVEEHAESCELLTLWLSAYGYELVTANTLSDGLGLAKSGAFSVYILSGRSDYPNSLLLCAVARFRSGGCGERRRASLPDKAERF